MVIMLRAAGIAIIALVLVIILRGTSGGFAAFVKAGAILLLFGTVIFELFEGIGFVRELVSDFIEPDSFVGVAVSVMLKALGISLIGRICADICRECGENGIAQGVESVAGIVIFSLSLPILSKILSFASDVLQRGFISGGGT